jgi:hypothetical protein
VHSDVLVVRSSEKMSINIPPMYMVIRLTIIPSEMIYVPKTPQSVASNTKDQMQDPEMQIPKCYQQIQKGIHYQRHAKHTMRLEIGAKMNSWNECYSSEVSREQKLMY